jgi:hypothetical protein
VPETDHSAEGHDLKENAMNISLPVATIMDVLAKEEQKLKKVGAFASAEGVRYALVAVMRKADEEVQPLEPSDPRDERE